MPRSKKRKTAHHNSRKEGGDLSHAEIWDDSALIRSWNDAVAEYEFYHSIHAKGEDVEEVLRQAEAAEEAESAAMKRAFDNEHGTPQNAAHATGDADEVEDGEVSDSGGTTAPEQTYAEVNTTFDSSKHERLDTPPATKSSFLSSQSKAAQNHASHADNTPSSQQLNPDSQTAPQGETTTSSIEVDQTLENIKMAYYWAGYYSGLYEGQRQAQTQVQTKDQGSV